MRVIGGRAKRLQLKTLEGMDTRPTTDRIKETLFNMIDPWLLTVTFWSVCRKQAESGLRLPAGERRK